MDWALTYLVKSATPWSRRIAALARAGKNVSIGGTKVLPGMPEGSIVDLVSRHARQFRSPGISPTKSTMSVLPETAAERATNFYSDPRRHKIYREALRHLSNLTPEAGPATAAERLARMTTRNPKARAGMHRFQGTRPGVLERLRDRLGV